MQIYTDCADLARDLRKELRPAKFDKTAESLSAVSFFKVFENYGPCYDVLGALVKFRGKKAGRGGGGPPFWKMQKAGLFKAKSWGCS